MSRKINRDHAKKKQRPMVEDQVIAEHLTGLLTPAIKSQSRFFRELGPRERILTLPLMVAAVLTLLWRDVPGVTELARLLETEDSLCLVRRRVLCPRTLMETSALQAGNVHRKYGSVHELMEMSVDALEISVDALEVFDFRLSDFRLVNAVVHCAFAPTLSDYQPS